MQYVPINEKSPELPVDKSLLIFVLALLALVGEQARCKRLDSTSHQPDLPVIAF